MGGPIPQAKCFGKAKAGELEKLGKCRGVDFLILFRFYSVFFFFFKFYIPILLEWALREIRDRARKKFTREFLIC